MPAIANAISPVIPGGAPKPLPAKYSPIYWVEATQGNIVLDTGPPATTISAWPDKGSAGGSFDDTLKANQPLDVTINGHRAPQFVKANSTKLVHTSAASYGQHLHDGTGCTMISVVRFNAFDASRSFFFNTMNSTAITSKGIGFRETSNNGTLLVESFNGTATVIFSASAAGTLVVGTSHVITWRFDLSKTPDFDVRVDGVSKISGNVSAAPFAGSPDLSPRIGCQRATVYHADCYICSIFSCVGYLSDTETYALETYFARFK